MKDKTATHPAELSYSFPTNQWFLMRGSSIPYSVLEIDGGFLVTVARKPGLRDVILLQDVATMHTEKKHRVQSQTWLHTSQYLDLGYGGRTMSSRSDGGE